MDSRREAFWCATPISPAAISQYEKWQRALKAEVNEAAWAELYATKSCPFDRPDTGKIAVKVINHYGDEVLVLVKRFVSVGPGKVPADQSLASGRPGHTGRKGAVGPVNFNLTYF